APRTVEGPRPLESVRPRVEQPRSEPRARSAAKAQVGKNPGRGDAASDVRAADIDKDPGARCSLAVGQAHKDPIGRLEGAAASCGRYLLRCGPGGRKRGNADARKPIVRSR